MLIQPAVKILQPLLILTNNKNVFFKIHTCPGRYRIRRTNDTAVFFFMAQRATDHPQFKQGYLYVVRLLTISRKSESELKRKLEEKGYLKEVIDEIFKALRAKGIVNDAKLVEETVQWGIHSKRYGKRRIFVELKKKGVAEARIEEALKQYPEATEKEIARELAQLRWEKLQKVTSEKRKKRLYDYLLGRGFGFELARELVTELEAYHHEKC